jgi:hypothetical protein
MTKRITVGSQAFFSGYEDFDSNDMDFVEFQDEPEDFRRFKIVRENGEEVFYYKTMPKEELIESELEHCKRLGRAAGKFLVPELVEFIGFTIEDLKLFEEAFNHIDDKHSYEKKIYDSYIENEGFTLTQEQRDEAYQIYKEKRIKTNE